MNTRENKLERDATNSGELIRYYDDLAPAYEERRFQNSYGRYIDAQERRTLGKWLDPMKSGAILDLACGSGRLLNFATHGLDASEAMVQIARTKHPQKEINCGWAENLRELKMSFDAIFCFHLFMHLSRCEIEAVIRVCFGQLRPGGRLIFDFPSALRRKVSCFQPTGWHGGTALRFQEIRAITKEAWRLRASRGIVFFPIHRLPSIIRPCFRPLDNLVGMTCLKELSSYLLVCLERKS